MGLWSQRTHTSLSEKALAGRVSQQGMGCAGRFRASATGSHRVKRRRQGCLRRKACVRVPILEEVACMPSSQIESGENREEPGKNSSRGYRVAAQWSEWRLRRRQTPRSNPLVKPLGRKSSRYPPFFRNGKRKLVPPPPPPASMALKQLVKNASLEWSSFVGSVGRKSSRYPPFFPQW